MLAGPRAPAAFDFQTLMLLPVEQPLSAFTLPPIDDEAPGFSSSDLSGTVTLLNIFASWCAPCREEHGVLLDLAEQGVPVYGLNYKDSPAAARRWLQALGNPYLRTGADRDGGIAHMLELRGLPQTMVVDASGRIAYVHVGAMTKEDAHDIILPLITRLRQHAP